MVGQPELVVVGVVERVRGLKGEVKIKPLTDDPQRFHLLRNILLENKKGEVRQLKISKVSVIGQQVFLCFDTIDDRQKARELVGGYLEIQREELLPLENGQYYHFQLEGLTVKTSGGAVIGQIRGVLDLAANDVLVVESKGKETLIPFIKDVVLEVSLERGEVIIEAIEGLLD